MAGYRWFRLDTHYFENPKIVGLSMQARALHIASMAHCVKHLTDGQIAYRSLTALATAADIHPKWRRRRAAELVAAGLWEPNDVGWHLHDFEDANPQAMRAVVERDRAAWRVRQARARGDLSRRDIEGNGEDVTP